MTRRERLAHPLDDVPSIKLKLGFVIAAAVSVTVFVFWIGLKLGLWPSVSGIIAAAVAMTMVWFLSRGMTSPLPRDGRRGLGDGEGQLRPPGALGVARRGRRARPGLQPHGRRSRRDRPRAPRPRRQCVARAAHTHHRAPGRAREPGRWRHRARPRDVRHDAGAGRAARPPGEAAPRSLPSRVGRGAPRPDRVPRRAVARARRARIAAPRAPRSRCRSRWTPTTSPPTATPSACTRCSRTCSRTQYVTRRAEASSRCGRGATITAWSSRCSTRGPASPRPTRPACSSASTAPTPPARRVEGGAGLGLAIAQWIVDLHGGDIHPERREPHGCRMVVTLPNH